MAAPILYLRDVFLNFGGTPLLEGADLSVHSTDRICLVGRNGSGKSTLLKIAAGLVEADKGERFVQPGTTLRYLPQEPDLTQYESAWSYVEDGLAPGDDRHAARRLLEELSVAEDQKPKTMSGGEARRTAIVRALAAQPDILLLDEPTNHLDIDSRQALVGAISAYQGAVILVTHDLHLVELCADRLWVARNGTCQAFDGDIDDYRKTILESRRASRRRDKGERSSSDSKQDRRDARRASASARSARSSQRKAAAAAERRLEALGKEKKVVEAKLADPALYKGPPFEIAMLNKQLADLDRKIGTVEAVWLAAEEAMG